MSATKLFLFTLIVLFGVFVQQGFADNNGNETSASKDVPALYLRKFATFFERFDVDKDGALSIKDFEQIADKLVESAQPSAERGATLKAQFVEVWENYFKRFADKEGLIQELAALEAAKASWNNADSITNAKSVFTVFFHFIDTDEAGVIDETEYLRFFKVLGIDEAIAKVSFQAIDADQDEKLSLEEYVDAVLENLIKDDESSKNVFLWGPLLD